MFPGQGTTIILFQPDGPCNTNKIKKFIKVFFYQYSGKIQKSCSTNHKRASVIVASPHLCQLKQARLYLLLYLVFTIYHIYVADKGMKPKSVKLPQKVSAAGKRSLSIIHVHCRLCILYNKSMSCIQPCRKPNTVHLTVCREKILECSSSHKVWWQLLQVWLED